MKPRMKLLLAVTVLALSVLPSLSQENPLFIEDDFPRAVFQAKAKKEPIFVDAWAPW